VPWLTINPVSDAFVDVVAVANHLASSMRVEYTPTFTRSEFLYSRAVVAIGAVVSARGKLNRAKNSCIGLG